jgi:hypothetical protein
MEGISIAPNCLPSAPVDIKDEGSHATSPEAPVWYLRLNNERAIKSAWI